MNDLAKHVEQLSRSIAKVKQIQSGALYVEESSTRMAELKTMRDFVSKKLFAPIVDSMTSINETCRAKAIQRAESYQKQGYFKWR